MCLIFGLKFLAFASRGNIQDDNVSSTMFSSLRAQETFVAESKCLKTFFCCCSNAKSVPQQMCQFLQTGNQYSGMFLRMFPRQGLLVCGTLKRRNKVSSSKPFCSCQINRVEMSVIRYILGEYRNVLFINLGLK